MPCWRPAAQGRGRKQLRHWEVSFIPQQYEHYSEILFLAAQWTTLTAGNSNPAAMWPFILLILPARNRKEMSEKSSEWFMEDFSSEHEAAF